MNKLLKHNACHIHAGVTYCSVKQQTIQKESLKMRLMRALNLRYLSLESERSDKQHLYNHPLCDQTQERGFTT
jgi:hypothetical protein